MWSEKMTNYIPDRGFSKKDIYEKTQENISRNDATTLIKNMDNTGIDKALTMGVDLGFNPDIGEAKMSVEEMNQWVADQVAPYSDRLYALCAVDPRRGEQAIKLVEKAVDEWGMVGIKFYPPAGFFPDNPTFYPLYERMVELDIALHSHSSVASFTPCAAKYADPIYLDSIASRFPDLKINMIHMGGMNNIFKCVELMYSRPNLYADITGQQQSGYFMEERFLRTLGDILNTPSLYTIKDRIMFGTDWPLFADDSSWVDFVTNIPERAKKYGIRIKQRDIKNILGENAKKFLKL